MITTKKILKYDVGNCKFGASETSNSCGLFQPAISDPAVAEVIKSYDRILHQSLTKVFGGSSCLSYSGQIKKLSYPEHSDPNSMIKMILKQEPIISKQYPNGEYRELSLLWMAVLCCYQDSAELLVRSGADVNELFGRHNENWTVLHALIQMDPTSENERLVRLVADHGANLQARDRYGRTALHHALIQGRVELTEMLLEKEADINAADEKGNTPLLVAAISEKVNELLPLLMRHGADVTAKDKGGKNVLHAVAMLSCKSVMVHADLVKALIEKGASLECSMHDFQPIHTAALLGNNEMVKLFLDHGANVNAQVKRGEFPLYTATKSNINPSRVVETLLKRGADIGLRTTEGRTPLHNACECLRLFNEDENTRVIRLLLLAGADLLVEDNIGRTPFAVIENHRRIGTEHPSIRLLIKELALKKGCLPSVELKDEMIMKQNSKLWKYYQDCHVHISRMKDTRFVGTCTFFELLTKKHEDIAALMRNPNFEANFELYDLKGFSMYAEDILGAFQRAHTHYHFMLEQEDVISEAVYDILPYMVVRKVARYIPINCEGCGMI